MGEGTDGMSLLIGFLVVSLSVTVLAVCSWRISRQEEESGYEWIHLQDDTMYAVLPKDYPIDGRTGYPLSEFDGRDFIMPAQGFDKDIMRIFNRVGVKPHILPTAVDDRRSSAWSSTVSA